MQYTNPHDSRTPSAQAAHTAAHQPHIAAHQVEYVEGDLVEGAPYLGKELAEELGIADSTLRNRWLPWL